MKHHLVTGGLLSTSILNGITYTVLRCLDMLNTMVTVHSRHSVFSHFQSFGRVSEPTLSGN